MVVENGGLDAGDRNAAAVPHDGVNDRSVAKVIHGSVARRFGAPDARAEAEAEACAGLRMALAHAGCAGAAGAAGVRKALELRVLVLAEKLLRSWLFAGRRGHGGRLSP
mmetsp:Transcript_12440/g.22305  ORF Transcript_12440/g.22305 Transcript_12440/m.22305 type:complete len:109 (+) Transcript_12440:1166-1492(+)